MPTNRSFACSGMSDSRPDRGPAPIAHGRTVTCIDETRVREVLMVQAFETTGEDSPLWTAEDRAWATRAATESLGAGAPPEPFIAERARASGLCTEWMMSRPSTATSPLRSAVRNDAPAISPTTPKLPQGDRR